MSIDLSKNNIGSDGAFYLGEQLRFNPQLVVLKLDLNKSIERAIMSQIQQQLTLNKQFQQNNLVPNLHKERGYLTRKTCTRNFTRVAEKQHQAIQRYHDESGLYESRKRELLRQRVEQRRATRTREVEREQLLAKSQE